MEIKAAKRRKIKIKHTKIKKKDINYSTEGEKVNDQRGGQVHSTETGADQSLNSSFKINK